MQMLDGKPSGQSGYNEGPPSYERQQSSVPPFSAPPSGPLLENEKDDLPF
jgi:hypothetical protein